MAGADPGAAAGSPAPGGGAPAGGAAAGPDLPVAPVEPSATGTTLPEEPIAPPATGEPPEPTAGGPAAPEPAAAPEPVAGPEPVVAPEPDSSPFPEGVVTPRIMIVGDSISAGPGCYKKYLDQNLAGAGLTNYEFVGEYDDGCGGGIRHSAVSCTTSGQFAEPDFTVPDCFAGETFPGMSTLVATHDPDLVMIQLGVNDVWGGSAPIEPILGNYFTLIEQARAHNPNIVVVVAQIHRIITDSCTNEASTANAEQLVMAVPAWAEGVSTEASPVFVADLWTNSDAREADDCVHPNDAGAQRMGENWFNALRGILE